MSFSFDDQEQYGDQTFDRVRYAGRQVVRREFDRCAFADCAFTETAFSLCRFRDCIFKECDLRLAQLRGSTFVNTRFEKSKVTGVDWTVTTWPDGGLFTPVHFNECDISLSSFFGLNLKKTQIIRCTAKEVNFSEADLTQADCTFTDFAESHFLHTNLTEADFTHATNYTIAAGTNTLKKTKFSLPEAVRLLHSLDIVLVE